MSARGASPVKTVASAAAGFAPWILYWALLGSVPFRVAVLAAVALSVAVTGWPLVRGRRPMDFDIGTAFVFLALLVAAFTLDDAVIERWMQPLTNAGLFLVATVLQLAGRPFTLPYALASVDAATAETSGFRWVNRMISGTWCVTFAVMTIVSAVPPTVEGNTTARDGGSLLSVLGYWVIPFTLLGLTGAASSAFPGWFVARLDRPAPERRAPSTDQPTIPPASADGRTLTLTPLDALLDGPAVVRAEPSADDAEVAVGLEDADGVWWWGSASARGADLQRGFDVTEVIGRLRPPGLTDADLQVFPPAASGSVAVIVRFADGRELGVRGVRRAVPADATVSDVAADQVTGRLFLPAGPGPHPGVVLFPGSEGGLDSQTANAGLLAGHGFAALVAATTAAPGRPDELVAVPLETFRAAIDYLAGRPEVDAERIAAMSISKGAEGLLAAAAALELPVRGLVLVSPSEAVWQAIGKEGPIPHESSWSLDGKPLPFRPLDGEALMPQLLRNAVRANADRRRGRPTLLRLRPSYAAECGAEIDVRAVRAPLLLVAGEADELWPSARMARAIAARRGRADDELVVYPGAGHLLMLPHRPTSATFTDGISFGGSPVATAAAQRDLAGRVEAFLRRCMDAEVRTEVSEAAPSR